MPESSSNRRKFIKIVGGSSVAGASMLAGCSGESGDDATTTDGSSGATDSEATTTAAGEVSRGGELVAAISTDPPAPLHPHKTRSSQGVMLARAYANSLVALSPEGEVVPEIAESVDASEDATTFVVTLREDVTFHPPYDRQLTAEDVVENFRRILDEEYGATSLSNFQGFLVGDGIDPEETVRQTGEFEVTFELAQPFADFVNTLTSVFILPMEAVDEHGDDFGTMGTGTWGTGPYTFTEGQKQDHYTFEAFDDYFETGEDDESLPYLDGVRFEVVPESSTRMTQIETGEVDVASPVPASDADSLESADDISVESTSSVIRMCNFLNLNKEEFQKRKVRQAMMHAVNREAIVDVAYNGYAEPGWGVFPPWHWAHSEDATQTYPYDPERAQQLLEEAGETDLSFECLVPNQPPFSDVAEILGQNYADVGIDMEINTVEESSAWGSLLGQWGNEPPGPSPEDFETNVQTLSVEMYADSFAYWKYHTGHFLNVTYYDQSDDVIEEARQTTDRDEREDLYAQLEQEATEYVDRIGLVWPSVIQATRSSVRNYDVYPNQRIILTDVWLDG